MGKLKNSVLKQKNDNSDDMGKDPMSGDVKNESVTKGKGKKYSPAAIKAACK